MGCLEYYKEDAQDSVCSKIQFIEFNKEMDNKRNLKKNSNVLQQNIAKEDAKDSDSPESVIDEHYFNQILQTDNNKYKEMKQLRLKDVLIDKDDKLNSIDCQMFSNDECS